MQIVLEDASDEDQIEPQDIPRNAYPELLTKLRCFHFATVAVSTVTNDGTNALIRLVPARGKLDNTKAHAQRVLRDMQNLAQAK